MGRTTGVSAILKHLNFLFNEVTMSGHLVGHFVNTEKTLDDVLDEGRQYDGITNNRSDRVFASSLMTVGLAAHHGDVARNIAAQREVLKHFGKSVLMIRWLTQKQLGDACEIACLSKVALHLRIAEDETAFNEENTTWRGVLP